MIDLLTDPQAWITLITLSAIEIVLGIDNLVFISIAVSKPSFNSIGDKGLSSKTAALKKLGCSGRSIAALSYTVETATISAAAANRRTAAGR